MAKEYPGYPEYVVITLPKQGTKTMNKCFTSLGYKVFDAMQLHDFAKEFNDYGTEKIQFSQLAKIWEDNKFEVIVEPSALYWKEMAEHWPKTKFIHLIRDLVSWKKSLLAFVGTLADLPKGSLIDHHHYASPMISPTAHFAHNTAHKGKVIQHYRMFHADVICNAPQDRTLFNYNAIQDGWPKLREYLGLPVEGDEKFPHENKAAQAQEFFENLFNGGEYETKVNSEVKAYFASNGYDVKKFTEK